MPVLTDLEPATNINDYEAEKRCYSIPRIRIQPIELGGVSPYATFKIG